MSKKNNTNISTEIETTSSKETTMTTKSNTNSVKFVTSDVMPEFIASVSFTPANHNGLNYEAKTEQFRGFFNAIREFAGNVSMPAGTFVHIHNADRSKYDGMKMFYLGGNIVHDAIENGDRSISVDVNGTNVTVELPKSTELIGEWVRVMMSTDHRGKAWKAIDDHHMIALDTKHTFLQKLFNGTRIFIWVQPSLDRKGNVSSDAARAAALLQKEMLESDGTFKTDEEMLKPMYDRMNEYKGNNKMDTATKTLEKLAPVAGITIKNTIVVDGVESSTDSVQPGVYRVITKDGEVKYTSYRHFNNLNSASNLQTMATKGYSLLTAKF